MSLSKLELHGKMSGIQVVAESSVVYNEMNLPFEFHQSECIIGTLVINFTDRFLLPGSNTFFCIIQERIWKKMRAGGAIV